MKKLLTNLDFYFWQEILIHIYTRVEKDSVSFSDVAYDMHITYSHVSKLKKVLVDKKLILLLTKDKRTKFIRLTNKGNQIAKRLFYIKKIL